MSRKPSAFTIVELLIVIALIALLVTIVIIGMGGVRNSANRTESANALRQIVAAYNSYSSDHRHQLMPGYVAPNMIFDGNPPKQVNEIDLRVRIPDKSTNQPDDYLAPEDTASYVWRLAPYLDHAWLTFMVDYRSRGLTSRLNDEFDQGVFGPYNATANEDYGIAGVPSFGLNSIFVGGDTSHGGTTAMDRHPWNHDGTINFDRPVRENQRLAATRFTEVRNPARLIVFGPAARANAAVAPGEIDPYEDEDARHGVTLGYFELRPPFTMPTNDGDWSSWDESSKQWRSGRGGRVEAVASGEYGGAGTGAGLPIVRWGTTQYPVAHLDGSTSVEDLTALSMDMRRWSPFTVGLDPPRIGP